MDAIRQEEFNQRIVDTLDHIYNALKSLNKEIRVVNEKVIELKTSQALKDMTDIVIREIV